VVVVVVVDGEDALFLPLAIGVVYRNFDVKEEEQEK